MQKIDWPEVDQQPIKVLSPAFRSSNLVFTSGSVGYDRAGNLPDDITEQTENAIHNLEKVLKASGSTLALVMKVLLFISDRKDAAAVNKVYAKYFPHAPARSCVMVQFPNADIKVELECVAEVSAAKL